jgi:NADPH:quinone reductase-like Zn-dependent oxidoreductase
MIAVAFAAFGGPEVLQVSEMPEPVAKPGQIRVRVRAAGVNPVDWKIRRGWMEQAFKTALPSIPGSEFAGVVDQIGAGISGVTVGDDVLGWSASGAYAQFALAEKFVHKPATMSPAIAAALPIAGETAMRVLNLLDLKADETILIHGAAGAVGSIAVQLAVARGARVIGTASPANGDYVRLLGAIPVAYGDGLVDRVRVIAPDGVDAAFDTAGHNALAASVELCGGPGRVVTIADMDAAKYGVRFSAGTAADHVPKVLADLVKLCVDGKLQVTIAQVFPLASAAEAQAVSESGHARGKLVLTLE